MEGRGWGGPGCPMEGRRLALQESDGCCWKTPHRWWQVWHWHAVSDIVGTVSSSFRHAGKKEQKV